MSSELWSLEPKDQDVLIRFHLFNSNTQLYIQRNENFQWKNIRKLRKRTSFCEYNVINIKKEYWHCVRYMKKHQNMMLFEITLVIFYYDARQSKTCYFKWVNRLDCGKRRGIVKLYFSKTGYCSEKAAEFCHIALWHDDRITDIAPGY